MRIFSKHNPSFDIVNQRSDPLLSPLYGDTTDDLFKRAYDWLFSKINTRYIIWCFPENVDSVWDHGCEYKKWILDVPDDKIICILDYNIWHYILSWSTICPEYIYSQADTLFPDGGKDHFEYIMEKTAEYESNFSREDQYLQVFVNDIEHNGQYNQIIIPSPVDPAWVVDIQHCCEYDYDVAESGIINRYFRKEDTGKLLEYCIRIESFLNGNGYTFTKSIVSKLDNIFVEYKGWA